MRSGIVLGARGGVLATQLPLFRWGLGARLGDGEQWMSWISLDDEIRALVHVGTDHTVSGPCNFTAPNPVTNAEFTKTLAHELHRPAWARLPRRALRLATGTQVSEEFVLASTRVVPARLQQAGFQFSHPTLTEALRAAITASRHK